LKIVNFSNKTAQFSNISAVASNLACLAEKIGMDEVQKHFDEIAPSYDYWKRKNWYYYDAVKKIYKSSIPAGSRVLEIGCGTGEILAELRPSLGIGVDVSGEMIKRAQEKYANFKNLTFFQSTAADFRTEEKFDYIILADVIEHLDDVRMSVRNIAKLASDSTKVIVSMANPLWEPILDLAEKLKLKMPEGPHERISIKELIEICRDSGLSLRQMSYHLPFPKYIPVFSNIFNAVMEKIPFLNRLGVITVFIFKK